MRANLTKGAIVQLLCLVICFTRFNALKKFQRVQYKFPLTREKSNSDLAPKQYPSMNMTPSLKLFTTFLLGLASATLYWNAGRQFETVDTIPSQYFKEQKTIEGEVVKVNDGDTFRYL